jgi:hypothetical protein
MACQKPRDFRLRANVLGRPAVDLGSNESEFWYWISEAKPAYVHHCSYAELATGKVNVPFPFQPDMVMAALNMSEYDPKATYDLKINPATKAQPETLVLSQDTKALNGQAVKRITVFNRVLVRAGEPQVMGHILADTRGNLICRATVQKVTVDRTTGAVVPTRVIIEWPAQSATMTLMLSDIQLNSIDKTMSARLFQRGDLTAYDSYDLARGVVDSPGARRGARR